MVLDPFFVRGLHVKLGIFSEFGRAKVGEMPKSHRAARVRTEGVRIRGRVQRDSGLRGAAVQLVVVPSRMTA